jgi:4-hydroxybenzoyl-CoA thioesterase
MAYIVNRIRLTVEWGHCDPAGIVFNSRFFEYFDTGTWVLFEVGLGAKRSEIGAAYGIIGYPIVDARASFLVPVKFGETIEIASTVREFRRSSFDVEHRITSDGVLAVEGMETRVWVARGADDQLKARPIPAEVIERFKSG